MEYDARYDSVLLRGWDDPETPRPWQLSKEILNHAGQEKTLLDVGCGTAFKIIPLSYHFKEIVGLDPSQSMLNAARRNKCLNQVDNLHLVMGTGQKIPFPKHSFDVITCMLSRWDVAELHRVLKPNGILIVEHIGSEDKKDFKSLFGKDKNGWRGQFLEYSKADFLKIYHQMFSEYFNYVSIQDGFWNTFYKIQGLYELLSFTPIIRNFDPVKDEAVFQEAIKRFKTPQGVQLQQNRILIYAQNI
jgi:SAM-dependent methyltransferase